MGCVSAEELTDRLSQVQLVPLFAAHLLLAWIYFPGLHVLGVFLQVIVMEKGTSPMQNCPPLPPEHYKDSQSAARLRANAWLRFPWQDPAPPG